MGSEDSEGRRRGIYPFMQRLLFGFFDIFFQPQFLVFFGLSITLRSSGSLFYLF